MDHGFTREHFQLLGRWANHHYDAADPEKADALAKLRVAYSATHAWADALQARLFPLGEVEIREAPINQGHVFSPYTWAKIYPARSSPRALAFTVGIDADGFVVKIDTVGKPAQRAAYEALRGPSNAGSPFGEVLSAREGLRLSFEQLVDWSVRAIGSFRIGYEELLEQLRMSSPRLTLVTDGPTSRAAFAAWRSALLDGAIHRGALFLIPEGGIVARPGRSGREADEDRMELGTDPAGRSWAVQINEPRIPGDHNSLSAIGIAQSGERFLLRQGFLRPNTAGGHTISGEEFQSRTGLQPMPVEAQGLAAKRQWFIVCGLEAAASQIRLDTARFVDRCAAARAAADAGEPAPDLVAGELFGGGEAGGRYRRKARPAVEEAIVLRRHGSVWLALAELLGEAGLRVRKGRHPLGYEVDAEIDGGGSPPLLVEIKSGTSAGEIHAGVGQLHLYPRLIPRLENFGRALLLPSRPSAAVVQAVEACGIEIHVFKLQERGDGQIDVAFSGDFLRRCGLPRA